MGVLIRPIDKTLLTDTIVVIDQQSGSNYTIDKVRVQLVNKPSAQYLSAELEIAKSIVFIDYTNSSYTDLDCLKVGNVVVYNSKRYVIQSIEVVKAFVNHHIELRIV